MDGKATDLAEAGGRNDSEKATTMVSDVEVKRQRKREENKRRYYEIRNDPVRWAAKMEKNKIYRQNQSAERRAQRLKRDYDRRRGFAVEGVVDAEKLRDGKMKQFVGHLNRRSKLTEEDLARERQNKYFAHLATKARMSKEEKAEYDRVSRLYRKKRKENMSEEKYKQHLQNIKAWLVKDWHRVKREDPEKYRARMKRAAEYQKKAKERWTEEDYKRKRIYYRIAQRRKILRVQGGKEGWSDEEVKRRILEMEDALWREGYPDGKPPPKPRPKSTGRPRIHKDEWDHGTANDNFLCLKCAPKWSPEEHKWKPRGYMTKFQLLRHVKLRHKLSCWPCEYCDVLKYSDFSLQVHLKVCPKSKQHLKESGFSSIDKDKVD